MDIDRKLSRKGCFILMGIFVFVFLSCLGSVVLIVETGCVQEAKNWLPDYPGSELISQTYSGWRPFGIGTTTRIIYTTDDEDTVWDWYHEGDVRRGQQGIPRVGGFAEEGRELSADEDGGTTITLYNECKSDFIR